LPEEVPMKVVITFDLASADTAEYDKAYDMLCELGLERLSLNKGVTLPSTTVMGELKEDVGAGTLRDYFWGKFKAAGLRPTALFGGVLQDWAVKGK
jgi:hypothetical protein